MANQHKGIPLPQTYDLAGDCLPALKRIKKSNHLPSMSEATRAAIRFMDSASKSLSKPIDYTAAPRDLLRDYAVHGYDCTIRAQALAEIERRYNAKLKGVE